MSLSHFRDVCFHSSKLSNASIQEAVFKNVEFKYSNLIGIQMFRTNLKDIDFTTCDITGLVVMPQDLQGVIVDEYQAVELSRLLGIVIK